jgi:hypothetical protein
MDYIANYWCKVRRNVIPDSNSESHRRELQFWYMLANDSERLFGEERGYFIAKFLKMAFCAVNLEL